MYVRCRSEAAGVAYCAGTSTAVSEPRDITPDVAAERGSAACKPSGRNVIVVIGIDGYRHWQQLSNAVRDATGAAALFEQLGFQVTEVLIDDRATARAIQSLVTDELGTLGPDDSLVIFYAGHGSTRKHRVGDRVIKTGYLIPVDADAKVATWIDLEGWLRAMSLLPPRHILVVLDACHSGIALDPILKWRDRASWQDVPLETLRMRRSRRIITSALDDQIAHDGGPVYGHSLFTGCLIEGLSHGIRPGSKVTTGSELGVYLQQRVDSYPECRQTPDFGTFALDERGEMVIPLLIGQEHHPRGSPRIVESASSEPAPMTRSEAMFAQEAMPVSTTHPHRNRALPMRRPDPIPERPIEPWRRARKPRRTVVGATAAVIVVTLAGVLGLVEQRERTRASVAVPNDAAATVSVAPREAVVIDAAAAAHVATPEGPDARQRGKSNAAASPGQCPLGMVRVPGGRFRMGSPVGVGDEDEHPAHDVTLRAYCIDRTKVTVKAYEACVAAGSCNAATRTVQSSGYSTDDVKRWSRFCNGDERPDHPINCVDWEQATAYCAWAGGRLPSEAEWEFAARGNDGRKYPWGDEAPSANRLNACGSECVAMLARKVSVDWTPMYADSDGWETTAPVGRFPDGASPFGVLDMAGNLFEWTADRYGPYKATDTSNPPGPEADERRAVRGGSWYDFDPGVVRAAARDSYEPTRRNVTLGFRCVRGD